MGARRQTRDDRESMHGRPIPARTRIRRAKGPEQGSIEEFQAANRSLTEERNKYQAVFDAFPEPVVLLDREFRIQDMNHASAWQVLFNLKDGTLSPNPDSFKGKSITGLIPWLKDWLEQFAASGDQAGSLTRTVETGGGKVTWELNIAAISGPGKKLIGAAIFIRDRTRRMPARKEIEQMKNEFLAAFSHDLRTPLTSINASLGLLSAGAAGHVHDQAKKLVDIAQRNSERLTRLVNEIAGLDQTGPGGKPYGSGPAKTAALAESTGQSAESRLGALLAAAARSVSVYFWKLRATGHKLRGAAKTLTGDRDSGPGGWD